MNTTLQIEASASAGANGKEERDRERNNGQQALYKRLADMFVHRGFRSRPAQRPTEAQIQYLAPNGTPTVTYQLHPIF
jgi:hypothetical protein